MSNYAYTKQKLRWKGGQWGSRPLTGGGVSQDTKKSLKADTYIRPIRRVKTACLYGPYVRVSKNAPTHTAGMYGWCVSAFISQNLNRSHDRDHDHLGTLYHSQSNTSRGQPGYKI